MKKQIRAIFQSAVYQKSAKYVKERLSNRAVLWVLVIVAAWNVAVSFDRVVEHFQIPLHIYHWMWSWRSIPEYNATVVVVRIDDSLHWAQESCDSPTSRHLLAQLVRNASKAKAAVIAIDVQLYAPKGQPAGWHNPGREDQDGDLLDAINDAAKAGVKVVIPIGLVRDTNGGWRRIPNIYRDDELPLADVKRHCGYPACAVLGWIKLPPDKREIPLQEEVADWYSDSKLAALPSFALAAADAKSKLVPPSSKPPVLNAMAGSRPLFGGFLPENEFKKHEISAVELKRGDDSAMQKCANNLILIGGDWHSDQGYGNIEDLHLSPVGYVPGMILHANYIEALLGDHFESAVPLSCALIIDLAIGLSLYLFFGLGSKWWGKPLVLLFAAVPFFVAYLVFVNLNRYFDFVLPTVLYFIHLLYEELKHLQQAASKWRERST